MQKCDYLIVGAGFSGCVLAEQITSVLKKKVIIVDSRNSIGGNAYDYFDKNNVLIHKYGPHLFHTNNKSTFDYISRFTDWRKYEHKVLTFHKKKFYQMPVNINTINKYFDKNINNATDAKNFLDNIRFPINIIRNSEDIIVNKIGVKLFNAFFKDFTIKQWGLEPKELQPGVCGRIPVRFNFDDRYFDDRYQVIPKNGYFKLFEELTKNTNINIMLNKSFKDIIDMINYRFLIYTGPIDEYFNFKYGKLPYRSIKFKFKNINKDKFLEVAQINYVDLDVKYTRKVEYKHITGQKCNTTTVSYEYPQKSGEPFYPIPTDNNIKLYNKYYYESLKLKNVLFCGRLAEYKYYNMDQVIGRALYLFNKYIKNE